MGNNDPVQSSDLEYLKALLDKRAAFDSPQRTPSFGERPSSFRQGVNAFAQYGTPLGLLNAALKSKETPGYLSKGGFVDNNMLRGQLPMGGSIVGGMAGAAGSFGTPIGAFTAPAAAGIGGGAGQNLQDVLRATLGFNAPMSPKQAGLSALKGALNGAESEMGGQIINKGISTITKPITQKLSPKISRYLSTSSFKQPVDELSSALKTGEQTLGEQAIDRGMIGTKQTVLNKSLSKAKDLSTQLDDLLAQKIDSRVNPLNVVKELDTVKTQFIREGNKRGLKMLERKEADFVAQQLGVNKKNLIFTTSDELAKAGENSLLNPAEANVIKQIFQRKAKFGTQFLKSDSVDKEFSKAISRGLRKEIESIVPEAGYLNKELHIYNEIADSVANEMAKDLSRNGITLSEGIGVGAGAVPGLLTGNSSVVASGMAAGSATRSFPVKTFLAAKLASFSNGATKNMAAQLMEHPTFRRAIFRALSNAGAQVYNGQLKDKTKQ